MRVWDLPPSGLCRQHLLGEHREIHCLVSFLTTERGGSYRRHPETLRWAGKLAALKIRHDSHVVEMHVRGMTGHKTPVAPVDDCAVQDVVLMSPAEQVVWIRSKGCGCRFQ